MIHYETPHKLESMQAELDALQQRLSAIETAHARCDAQIRELHDQNTTLVQLTVASQLLASSLEREDVLSTIEEVVVNMIGSEELAIFDLDRDESSLKVARLRGLEAQSPRLARSLGTLRHVLKTGKTLVSRARRVSVADVDGGLTAAIPLKVDSNVTGVVAIFRLLEQKQGLDPVDHDLFEVLSRQAAMALHSTAFRSLRTTVRPPTMQ
jgi:chaperonin cofactor prefoldin